MNTKDVDDTQKAPPPPATRAGTVALLGRPNVGKSSLLNAILGEKIAATTHKPQTTQRQLRGIHTRGQSQIIFVDTPGLHKAEKGLHAFMVSQAIDAARDVDLLVVVVECFLAKTGEVDAKGKPIFEAQIDRRDEEALKRLDNAGVSRPGMILVINKIDRIDQPTMMLPVIKAWSETGRFEEIVPVSAHKARNLDALERVLVERLPFSEFWYDEDQLTTAGEREIASEIIREKALLELADEVPYKLAVVVEEFKESRRDDPKKPIVEISAVLSVERDSQKAIVVGKGGQRIKVIGQRARQDIERMLDCQVMLKLLVRVEPMWTEDERRMRKLGYREQS